MESQDVFATDYIYSEMEAQDILRDHVGLDVPFEPVFKIMQPMWRDKLYWRVVAYRTRE